MLLSLPGDATPDDAILWLRQLVRDFGLGFHLDSRPEDYVQPDGEPALTPDQCAELANSLERLFTILGAERSYEISADAAGDLLAELLGMKPPLPYHDPVFQQQLLWDGTREELIAWLCWNDPNGSYTDQDSNGEDRAPLTLDLARQIVREQLQRDSSS